jgi:hypothetical protein
MTNFRNLKGKVDSNVMKNLLKKKKIYIPCNKWKNLIICIIINIYIYIYIFFLWKRMIKKLYFYFILNI